MEVDASASLPNGPHLLLASHLVRSDRLAWASTQLLMMFTSYGESEFAAILKSLGRKRGGKLRF